MIFPDYSSDNIADIKQLFTTVFSNSEGNTEGLLIGKLAHELLTTTKEQDLSVFLAQEDTTLVGAVIFTRLGNDAGVNAYLLSPMAVLTSHQGKGIGQALIRHALEVLKNKGVEVVVTYGDPKFYSKTGFVQITEDQIKAPLVLSLPHGWLGQSLVGSQIPVMTCTTCAPALNKQEYW